MTDSEDTQAAEQPAATPPKFWKVAIGVMFLLVMAFFFTLMIIPALAGVSIFRDSSVWMDHLRAVLFFVRLGIYATLVVGWPTIVRLLQRKYELSMALADALLEKQWNVAGAAALFELLVVQRLPIYLIDWVAR